MCCSAARRELGRRVELELAATIPQGGLASDSASPLCSCSQRHAADGDSCFFKEGRCFAESSFEWCSVGRTNRCSTSRCGPSRRPPTCAAVRTTLAFTRYCFTSRLLRESLILLLPLPPICKAHPNAIPLHDHCAVYAPPPTPPLYALHQTVLVMAISCKGQVPRQRSSFGLTPCVCINT